MAELLNIPEGHVPVTNPAGELGHVPQAQLDDALTQGYTAATPDDVTENNNQALYGHGLQQAGAAVEGLASNISLGTSPALEQALGVKASDIMARRDANPGSNVLGQVAGTFVNPLGEVGQLAAGATAVGKVGQAAIRTAIDSAIFQGTDEVAKAMSHDPDQHLGSALLNTGLAGLAGGVLGGGASAASHALWKATEGSKLATILGAVKGKVMGQAGVDHIAEAAAQAGVDMTPEVRAALSGETAAKQMAQELEAGGSGSGNKYRQSIDKLKSDASESMLDSLGKTPAEVEGLKAHSDFDAGKGIQAGLKADLDPIVQNLSDRYKPIQEKLSSTPLPEGSHNALAERLSQLSRDEGYNLSVDSPANKEINRIITDLPNLKTVEDLRKYQAVARENLFSANTPQLGRKVGALLRGAEEDAITHSLGKDAPQLLGQHLEARQLYKGFMDHLDNLNDRLHVGKYYGPESFMRALSEMAPEDVARRLGGKSDAGVFDLLQQMPNAAQALKDHQVSTLVKQASSAAGAASYAHGMNTKTLASLVNKMSPESREFVLGQGAGKFKAAQSLLESIPEKINPSGTARALDAIFKHMPGGIGTVLMGLSSHNPFLGMIVGHISRILGREAPDAVKLSVLKMLGSSASVEPGAFRTMVHVADQAYKGAKLLDRSVQTVLKPAVEAGVNVLGESVEGHEKLDKLLRSAQQDPNSFDSGDLGHYMPDHVVSAIGIMTRASQYMASIRPDTSPTGLLGSKRVPSANETAKYNRALSLVNQPLGLLEHLRQGTLTPDDIKAVATVHPAVYGQMQSKLLNALNSHMSKGAPVPHRVVMGLSMIAGQPLIASISPASMMLNQQQGQSGPQEQGEAPRPPSGDNKGIQKMASMNQTDTQNRESQRSLRN